MSCRCANTVPCKTPRCAITLHKLPEDARSTTPTRLSEARTQATVLGELSAALLRPRGGARLASGGLNRTKITPSVYMCVYTDIYKYVYTYIYTYQYIYICI